MGTQAWTAHITSTTRVTGQLLTHSEAAGTQPKQGSCYHSCRTGQWSAAGLGCGTSGHSAPPGNNRKQDAKSFPQENVWQAVHWDKSQRLALLGVVQIKTAQARAW